MLSVGYHRWFPAAYFPLDQHVRWTSLPAESPSNCSCRRDGAGLAEEWELRRRLAWLAETFPSPDPFPSPRLRGAGWDATGPGGVHARGRRAAGDGQHQQALNPFGGTGVRVTAAAMAAARIQAQLPAAGSARKASHHGTSDSVSKFIFKLFEKLQNLELNFED